MQWLKCLIGKHNWGRQENKRDAKLDGLTALFLLPVMLAFREHYSGPKECDRTCTYCGKKKVFPYDSKLEWRGY